MAIPTIISKVFSTLGAVALLTLMALLSTDAAPPPVKAAVVQVKGLSCPICVHRLEKVLSKLPGAAKAEVSLDKGQAVIEFGSRANVPDKQIAQTIRDAGFVPGKIEWREVQAAKQK